MNINRRSFIKSLFGLPFVGLVPVEKLAEGLLETPVIDDVAISGKSESLVNRMVIDSDGTLYAGGTFTTAGGDASNYIVKWSAEGWSKLGRGNGATS